MNSLSYYLIFIILCLIGIIIYILNPFEFKKEIPPMEVFEENILKVLPGKWEYVFEIRGHHSIIELEGSLQYSFDGSYTQTVTQKEYRRSSGIRSDEPIEKTPRWIKDRDGGVVYGKWQIFPDGSGWENIIERSSFDHKYLKILSLYGDTLTQSVDSELIFFSNEEISMIDRVHSSGSFWTRSLTRIE